MFNTLFLSSHTHAPAFQIYQFETDFAQFAQTELQKHKQQKLYD